MMDLRATIQPQNGNRKTYIPHKKNAMGQAINITNNSQRIALTIPGQLIETL